MCVCVCKSLVPPIGLLHRSFEVLNPTEGPYEFKWRCHDSGGSPFHCLSPCGTIQPGKTAQVSNGNAVVFLPSSDFFFFPPALCVCAGAFRIRLREDDAGPFFLELRRRVAVTLGPVLVRGRDQAAARVFQQTPAGLWGAASWYVLLSFPSKPTPNTTRALPPVHLTYSIPQTCNNV